MVCLQIVQLFPIHSRDRTDDPTDHFGVLKTTKVWNRNKDMSIFVCIKKDFRKLEKVISFSPCFTYYFVLTKRWSSKFTKKRDHCEWWNRMSKMKNGNGLKRTKVVQDENESKRTSESKEKSDKQKRKRVKKRRSSSSPEEDIIDGFVITSFSSLQSLEVFLIVDFGKLSLLFFSHHLRRTFYAMFLTWTIELTSYKGVCLLFYVR